MTSSFVKYSRILFESFEHNSRSHDIAVKKHQIFDELINNQPNSVQSVLFVGFNPAILLANNFTLYQTQVDDDVVSWLRGQGLDITVVDLDTTDLKFDSIWAMDEFFTFADTTTEQQLMITQIGAISSGSVFTSLRDYKNQHARDRDFSDPCEIFHETKSKIYFEQYKYNKDDQNCFQSTNYVISDDESVQIGPFVRRNMFFKQLAKFGFDSGVKHFSVHKNLMHKNLIKKNYEHIIILEF